MLGGVGGEAEMESCVYGDPLRGRAMNAEVAIYHVKYGHGKDKKQ
jgi:hypothetical protein